MAWTSLSFGYGSILTSAKMTQMYDNFAALAAGSASAPIISATNMSGNTSGSSATCTGNSATATALAAQVAAGSINAGSASGSFSMAPFSYTEKLNFLVPQAGTYRVYLALAAPSSGTAYGRIYKNGVAYGTVRSTTSSGNWTEDLAFAAGDTIQLFAYNDSDATVATLNLALRGTSATIRLLPLALAVGDR